MKLKAKTKKAIRGSITLMLVIILLPMMTFSGVIVDISRINLAKAQMAGAGDLTMNTALANYDTILKDVYGLFAMSQEKTEEELAADLKEYFAETISGYGVVSKEDAPSYVDALIGNFDTLISGTEEYEVGTQDFLKLDNLTVSADRVDESALSNSSVLRNQIVEYMKYRAPIEFGMSFIDSLKAFDKADDQMDVVETQTIAQEATQDVTTECQKLIKLIREYDDLIKARNKDVTGKDSSTDGEVVQIKDYPTHVDVYQQSWGENYQHIHKLSMVFRAKAPKVDHIYLVKQNFASKNYFIYSSHPRVRYSNSGISITVQDAASTAAAKTRTETQITAVNNLATLANKYPKESYLKSSQVKKDRSAFTNETNAINEFVAYEKFLLNKTTDIKYTDVENILENIYKLGKYYEDYYKKISAEINTAYTNWQNAITTARNKKTARDNASSNMHWYKNQINTLASDYLENDEDVSCLDGYLLYQKAAKNLLGYELGEITGGFEGYYNNWLKSGTSDKYQVLFSEIAKKLNDGEDNDTSKIAKAAEEYAKSGSEKTFEQYIKDKSLSRTNDLFKLLNCLSKCSDYAKKFQKGIKTYTDAATAYNNAVTDRDNKKQIYDNKVLELSGVQTKYNTCLDKFVDFVKAYQSDAYYYGAYVETATNIIQREVTAVHDQFEKIVKNISDLYDKQGKILEQIESVDYQIVLYLDYVGTWEDEVEAYEREIGGQDSFSKQSRQDIATAKETYSRDSLGTLKAFIVDTQERYAAFKSYLSEDVNFKYGGKRLHEIKTPDDVLTAAASNLSTITDAIITAEIADSNYQYLYRAAPGTDFIPHIYENPSTEETDAGDKKGQWCFLEPEVIFIQFLKYLNSAYPETAPGNTVKDKDGNEVDAKADYEATKSDLKTPDKSIDEMGAEEATDATADSGATEDKDSGDESEEGTTTVKTDKYGYSYKNVSLTDDEKNARPSKDTGGKSVSNKAFALNDDGKSSASVTEQKKGLNGVLGNIGSAVNAALENAYILTYIFENFSYNTMIQDAVTEANKDTLKGSDLSFASLQSAKDLMKGDTLSAVKDKVKTLSNVPKNAYNNYFYGAEVEYILYGSATPSTNVGYAKASIYAVRFAFNCIYAFTDTEIRNTTMAAGLAVQAATMGIVPYQVVQIVLQLAMAAAESAVDLQMMMYGLDVAIVKTKETWSLSLSGAVESAGAFLADTAADVAGKAINKATGALQGVIDASAEEITGSIGKLQDEIERSTEQAVEDVADQIFGVVTAQLEKLLNEIQYVDEETFGKGGINSWIENQFTTLETEINAELETTFAGNEVALKLLAKIKEKDLVNSVLTKVKTKITGLISELSPSAAVDKIIAEITSIKIEMITEVNSCIGKITGDIGSIATDAVASVKGDLKGYIDNAANMTTKEIQDGVKEATNKFFTETLPKTTGSASATGGGSVASVLRFGYKEYMMLFVYIGICAGGEKNPILLRTADMIQLNIAKAGDQADFQHAKKAGFRMKNACTYISLTADANLDMFFMDLGLFASVVSDDPLVDEDSETTLEEGGTKIRYRGLLGY